MSGDVPDDPLIAAAVILYFQEHYEGPPFQSVDFGGRDLDGNPLMVTSCRTCSQYWPCNAEEWKRNLPSDVVALIKQPDR